MIRQARVYIVRVLRLFAKATLTVMLDARRELNREVSAAIETWSRLD